MNPGKLPKYKWQHDKPTDKFPIHLASGENNQPHQTKQENNSKQVPKKTAEKTDEFTGQNQWFLHG